MSTADSDWRPFKPRYPDDTIRHQLKVYTMNDEYKNAAPVAVRHIKNRLEDKETVITTFEYAKLINEFNAEMDEAYASRQRKNHK
jgi:hypothetical protein